MYVHISYETLKHQPKHVAGGLGNDAQSDQRAGPIAALLCLWGRTHEVISLIATGLTALATGAAPPGAAAAAAAAPAQGKRKRAVGGLDAELAAVGVLPSKRALAMLDHLLQGAEPAAAKARALVLAAEMEGEGRIRAALGAVREAAAAQVKGEGEMVRCVRCVFCVFVCLYLW